MHRILAVAITALTITTLAGSALAQSNGAPTSQPAHCPHHRMGKVLKNLNLTADQKAQVKAIFKQARADAAKAPDRQAKKQIHKDAWQKVRTQVLTDAQRQQLDQMKTQWKAKHASANQP